MTPNNRVSAEGLRLLIFTDTYPPQVNGVARTLERLVGAVEARGGEARVVSVIDPEAQPDPRIDRWPSVPFWAYPQLRIAAPHRHRALDLIEQWKPNLIHSTTEFGVGLGGIFAAKEARVPLVTSYHTHFKAYLEFYNLSFLGPIAWPYFRWFHNLGVRTFAPSGIVARELEELGFENMRVWSRGVEPAKFSPSFRGSAMRERLGARGETPLVLYVGRLAREKGIHVLMEAMRRVKAERGDAIAFALVGDGPAEADCRASAPPGTVFTGKLTGRDLSEAYAAGDIFAFPSITETFGNVVLEGMASGLAVIAPDIGATTEYATAETSMHFRAGDAGSLADAISRVAFDVSARTRLAAASRATAASRTWDAVWDGLMRDYHEAIAVARRSASV